MNKVVHGKKTDISVVQQWAKNLGGKLLSTEYHNMLQKLHWRCGCGHEFFTTFNHVKNRSQWCPICGQKKGLASMRKTFKENSGVRKKISKSHLKRLRKDGWYCGKDHREIARRIRDDTAGILRRPSKHMRILGYLGCSIEEFKAHLESQFQEGMTWDNRGLYGWHIDHIKPLTSFDLTDPEQLKKACHYTNLQPLWAKDNLVKSNKIRSDTSESTDRKDLT